MKKTVSILCVTIILISCVLLAGCGSKGGDIPADSPYIGTWKAVRTEFKDETADPAEMLGGDFILELNADGTAKLITAGEEQTAPWSITSTGVKVKGDDVNMTFKSEGSTLTTSIIGVTIILEKQ